MKDIDQKIESLIDQQTLDGKSVDHLEHGDQQQVDFELQLQQKIDASLLRSFPTEPTQELLHRKKMEALVLKSRLPERRTMTSRLLVLAASVLVLASVTFVAWQNNSGGRPTGGVFIRQPLAMLYQDTLDRGFKPYYVCDDPVRFAAQFDKNLGIPMRLSEMPAHKQMAGISFLGGVTENSIAMLGSANNENVLIFIDRLDKDDQEMRDQVGESGDYHISRVEKDGLVFYEISANKNAQLVEYFEKAEQ